MPVQPCYEWWEVPYYWAGLKAYDVVANFGNLAMSAYITPSESLRRFPTLSERRSDGASLKGTVRFMPSNPWHNQYMFSHHHSLYLLVKPRGASL